MKAESTIKKRLLLIKKRINSLDTFNDSVKHKTESETVRAYQKERILLEGHLDALRWVLNQ